MTHCVHCGLPVAPGCSAHVQSIRRKSKATKTERQQADQQSIHLRVRNGRTVSPKTNTCKAKRGK